MKIFRRIAAGIVLPLLSVSSIAQTPVTTEKTVDNKQAQGWDYKKNPTVDSIAAKYRDKMVTSPAALTVEQVFPVLGKYESSTHAEAPVITITLDEQNKGIVWITGLPQGRMEAMMRKTPATYKIPAQKTDEGKEVKEGTLIYDTDMNTLSIILGKEYNAEDPASAFLPAPAVASEKPVAAKKKNAKAAPVEKPWIYIATKVNKTTDNSTGMNHLQ